MEAAVTPEVVPGIYTLKRVSVFSIGGRRVTLQDEAPSGIPERSFEIVEEPLETPSVSGIRFLG